MKEVVHLKSGLIRRAAFYGSGLIRKGGGSYCIVNLEYIDVKLLLKIELLLLPI